MAEIVKKKYSVAQLAKIAGAELIGSGTSEVCRVSPFESAGADCITFAADDELLKKISACKAAAVIVNKKIDSAEWYTYRDALNVIAFNKTELERAYNIFIKSAWR